MFKKLGAALKSGIITEQYSLSPAFKELGFAFKRGRGHLLSYLKNRLIWYKFPKWNLVTSFPCHVDIEISSTCQLNCPMCYTTTDFYKQRVQRTLMDYDVFTKIIDECAANGTYSVRFSWRGEPLLHPRVIDMLAYAKKKGIKEVSFLSNGGMLTPEIIDGLILNGLDWITVSFDGLGETYEGIRKPLKFEESVERLKLLQRRKKELGKSKPVLKVQSVWPAIEKDPQAYFQFMDGLADEIAFNPIKNKEYYNEYGEDHHKPDYVCPRLWQRMFVSSTGNIGICLCDVYEDLVIGKVGETTLKEAWNGPEFKKIRKKHLDHKRLEYTICRRCQAGLKRKKVEIPMADRTVEATRYEHS